MPRLRDQLPSLALRLGLPILAAWLVGAFVAGLSTTAWVRITSLVVPALLTVLAIGLVGWSLLQSRKAKRVAGLVGDAQSAEDRKAAMERLDQDFKKTDPAAVFAKAQLQLQEDPRAALETLERIDLNKVMANIADEARAQRAMIHLLLGQVTQAKTLVDGIELKRHEEPSSRALMVAVMSEAWARAGQPKRAQETLALYDPDDAAYEQVRPQLWRSKAYAAAHGNDIKAMRRSLRRLLDIDARLLAGFLGKRTHPLLLKEAKKMLEQSGAVPKKMVIQRR